MSAPSPPPIVALLTDFGQQDWFVGSMKAKILARCPQAAIVDLCHGVEPGNVLQGAWILAETHRDFPPGAVFCAVVDPGVGAARKPLVARNDDYQFVAPDNGLLCGVRDRSPQWRCFEIANPEWMRRERSHTFHGRDVFAPAAAWCAAGKDPATAGPPVDDPLPLDLPRPQTLAHGEIVAAVMHVDRFGNLLLNLRAADLERANQNANRAASPDENISCELGGKRLSGIRRTFADAAPGAPLLYWGSLGFLEIAINRGDAARELGLAIGDRIVFETGERRQS